MHGTYSYEGLTCTSHVKINNSRLERKKMAKNPATTSCNSLRYHMTLSSNEFFGQTPTPEKNIHIYILLLTIYNDNTWLSEVVSYK